jgi:hypothetical protein
MGSKPESSFEIVSMEDLIVKTEASGLEFVARKS